MHCVHLYFEKRKVFSDRPKTGTVYDGSRSEFQNIGPAIEKAQRPYVVSRWDGITSWWPAAERRCCLEAVVETGTQHVARYRGAEPYRHWRVITPSLYLTPSAYWKSQNAHSDMHRLGEIFVPKAITSQYIIVFLISTF